MSTPVDSPAYLTLGKAAQAMGISKSTLHRMVCAGEIAERFILKSGSRRPRIYLHASIVSQGPGAQS